MDWKLELVAIPVSDVDRAKTFYTDGLGFNADHDHTVREDLRFVQLTPPGSACSIAIGTGVVDTPPGSAQGMLLVVSDIAAATSRASWRWRRARRRSQPGAPMSPWRAPTRSPRERGTPAAPSS